MKTRLQEFRKRAGYKSAAAFAEHIGMNPRTYTNYEQGKRKLDAELLWLFADVFKCSIDEIIGRDVPEPHMDDPVQKAIFDAYEAMNDHGRARLLEEAEMMSESSRYGSQGR